MTSRTRSIHEPARRGALLLAASALPFAPMGAVAQEGRQAPARQVTQNWSLDLRATYTDNYRRLPEDLPRRIVAGTQTADGTFIPLLPLGTDTVSVEPPDNVVLTASLRGGGVYERPGVTAVLTGGVSVNAYTNNEAVDDRLLGPLTTTPIDPALTAGIPPGTPLDVSFGLVEDEEVFIQPDLVGSASVRLVDDLLFVDVSGLAQQQAISRRADLEAESAGQLGDRTTYAGGSVSPYLTRQVGGGGTVEARYRLSAVVVAQEEFEANFRFADPDRADDRFANDSLSQQVLAEYRSGDLLDRLSFAVSASAQHAEETGSDVLPEVTLDRLTAGVEGNYEMSRTIGLIARVGYDEVDVEEVAADGTGFAGDATRSDALSGAYWSLGASFTPSARTRATLSVGERFGGTLVEGDLRYQPTPRLRFTGDATRELGTGVEDTFQAFRALNSQTLSVVESLGQVQGDSSRRLLDRAVGLRGAFSGVGRTQGGLAVRNRVGLGVDYDAGRTSLSGRASYDEAEFESADGRERTNTTTTVDLSARRQVSRRVSLTARARYLELGGLFREELALDDGATVPDESDQNTTQIFASLDAAYQIGPRLSATGRVYHSRRESDGEIIGGTGLDYSENAASVGVRWTF